MESFFDHAGEVFLVENQEAVFHDWECHAEKVGLLESSFTNKLLVNLTSDCDQRNTVHVGICDTGDEIRRART